METKIRFLYHKPIGERGIGKAIVALTWFYGLFYNWKVLKYNYSHEEVWIPDKDGNFEEWIPTGFLCMGRAEQGRSISRRIYCLGQCFSSTTRGDANGVRFAPAAEVLKHPERWHKIEVEVDSERLEVALSEAEKLVGAKYDFVAVLIGFTQPIPIEDPELWYCSEILDWFKKLLRIYPKRHKRISPRRSAYLLSRIWGEPKPLT